MDDLNVAEKVGFVEYDGRDRQVGRSPGGTADGDGTVKVVQTPEAVRVRLGDDEVDGAGVDAAGDVRVDVGRVDDRKRRRHARRPRALAGTRARPHRRPEPSRALVR